MPVSRSDCKPEEFRARFSVAVGNSDRCGGLGLFLGSGCTIWWCDLLSSLQLTWMQNQGIFKIHTGDKLDNTLANLETRIAKAENGSQKRIGALRKKLADEHANLCSMIDKKLDQDAAMTDEEHEKFITEIAEMATRAHLRKVLKNKVKAIVKDIIEDVVEDVVEDVIDDIVNEKLAAIYRTQQQQARQLAAIMNWVRDI